MIKTLDIIVPVFNEEKTIETVIKKLEETDFCSLEKRLILVDDFSDDSTREILSKIKNHKVIFHDKNQGKGAAVATGIKNATADVVVIQDADLEYNPCDYSKLLKLIVDDEADVVYGSRLKEKSQEKSFLFLSLFANKFLTALTNILYGSKITDMETCYKAFKREKIKDFKIRAKKFDFEPEITAKVIKNKLRLKEVAISYNARAYSEGKKVKAKDALQAIFTLFYYRFFD